MSSRDVKRAVVMWEAIYHWILWRRFTLLSLRLRHVISRASTPHTFLLSHTFREVSSRDMSSRDVRIVCPQPNTWRALYINSVLTLFTLSQYTLATKEFTLKLKVPECSSDT